MGVIDMTVKKQWLYVVILISIIAISINALIFSGLMGRYFSKYMTEDYETHYAQIVDYATKVLSEPDVSLSQMSIELENHIKEPIVGITLYDQAGDKIVSVSSSNMLLDNRFNNNMMDGGMMGHRRDKIFDETDRVDLIVDGQTIGYLDITRNGSVADSSDNLLFKGALIMNSVFSVIIVLIIAIIIGLYVSKRMSKDLIITSDMARGIEEGIKVRYKFSKVREVRSIQQSLINLESRLKLKQKSRKALIDQMVHQTRTPLTILQAHIEGVEDNMIEMTPEVISTLENQIEQVTAIISNMSRMIDAENESIEPNMSPLEVSSLLNRIITGLRVQFEKKGIQLSCTSSDKLTINTDQHKLSQVIYNILINAYKFTDEKGQVLIAYQAQGNQIAITISDTGKGISEVDMTHIFDAYYQIDETFDGEGIGLYVAHENMLQLGGHISVESHIGVGTTFTLILPRGF